MSRPLMSRAASDTCHNGQIGTTGLWSSRFSLTRYV
jgi:hypothetical protein